MTKSLLAVKDGEISDNEANLEQLNDERMAQGLEAVPVAQIGDDEDDMQARIEALVDLKNDILTALGQMQGLPDEIATVVDNGLVSSEFDHLPNDVYEVIYGLEGLEDHLADLIRDAYVEMCGKTLHRASITDRDGNVRDVLVMDYENVEFIDNGDIVTINPYRG